MKKEESYENMVYEKLREAEIQAENCERIDHKHLMEKLNAIIKEKEHH